MNFVRHAIRYFAFFMTNFMIIGAYTQGFINRRKKAVPMKEAENSTDAKVPDVMDPKNTRRILPCCEHAYLIEIAKGQLIDDAFNPIPSVSSNYDILGEKFMDRSLSPSRYAQYLYVIIKIEYHYHYQIKILIQITNVIKV